MRETRTLEQLKGWDKNPRAIKKVDFERLKKQIQNHGQFKPVIITTDGEVLGGNMRLKAYKDLGIAVVWVSVVDPKDDAEKVGIALADNDRAGYYVEDELAELLLTTEGLVLDDYHLDFGKTLSAKDFADKFQPTEEDDFDVEENLPDEPVSKLGDIYQLGNHRLMCGSATEVADVEKLMGGVKADMVFTDPPYGIAHSGKGIDGASKSNDFGQILGDADISAAVAAINIVREMEIGKQVWWGGNYYCTHLEDGFGWIVWDKQKEGDVFSGFEIAYCSNGIKSRIYRHQWHGMIKASERSQKTLHPTQKPIKLCAEIIEDLGGRTILDLFGGSGSTLIACEQTDRICYMMELDPKYIDIIIKRWEQFTGLQAEIVQS